MLVPILDWHQMSLKYINKFRFTRKDVTKLKKQKKQLLLSNSGPYTPGCRGCCLRWASDVCQAVRRAAAERSSRPWHHPGNVQHPPHPWRQTQHEHTLSWNYWQHRQAEYLSNKWRHGNTQKKPIINNKNDDRFAAPEHDQIITFLSDDIFDSLEEISHLHFQNLLQSSTHQCRLRYFNHILSCKNSSKQRPQVVFFKKHGLYDFLSQTYVE